MTDRKIRLLLDPGHNYAKYNQSPVVKSYHEGARMWKLSQLLKTELEARGFEVGLTKSKVDQEVSVNQRGKMAKGYDALISLHSNACDTEKVDRPVGIYFVDDNCGKIDDVSKELAVLLSQTVAEVMGTSNPAKQSYKLSGNDKDGDGKKNDDYYGVLYGAHQVGVPAIILEHSFHTNKRAATWLMDDDNLKLLAEREADALAAYYGMTGTVTEGKPETIVEDIVTVKLAELSKGSEGAQVKALQQLLIAKGYDLGKYADDGDFGAKTKEAVKKYQSDNGLDNDGVVGKNTWAKLLKG